MKSYFIIIIYIIILLSQVGADLVHPWRVQWRVEDPFKLNPLLHLYTAFNPPLLSTICPLEGATNLGHIRGGGAVTSIKL